MTAPQKQWSKEPWTSHSMLPVIFFQEDGEYFKIAEFCCGISDATDRANVERAVDCVTFCTGLTKEDFHAWGTAKEAISHVEGLRADLVRAQNEVARLHNCAERDLNTIRSLTQQAEANKEARDGEAYSDKLLCELWDKLGARGKIDEHESAVERIRDLIATEAELTEIRADLLKYGQHVYPCNGVYPTGATDCKCGWMARKESLSQPSPVEAQEKK